MKGLIQIIAAASLLLSASNCLAEYGPYTKAVSIYSPTTTSKPFILFENGAMPGCYGDRGGYLNLSDEKGAERTFSILLTALTTKQSIRVYYEYQDVAPGYTGWGLCQITAIDLKAD